MSLEIIIKRIEAVNEHIGRIVAWCIPIMVFVICYDVTMRYVFQIGSVALQELEWHLFAMIFLLGAGYTFKHNGHVRIDIFHKSKYCSERKRAWIEIFGTIFFLFPFCILIVVSAWPFIINSYAMAEGSPDPGGLPFRFLLKSCISIAFILLVLQGVANLLKSILFLNTGVYFSSHKDNTSESEATE